MKNADIPENPERPASPVKVVTEDITYHYLGLSKREQFAAMAMQGILSGAYLRIDIAVAKSIRAADELLKALEAHKFN